MSGRQVTESYTPASPLKVDKEKGVIFGVRILGHESRNTYGVKGVEATEYSRAAHDDAVRLYEGLKVNIDHQKDVRTDRSSRDAFGVIHNTKTLTEGGRPATYGDLHYLQSHEMAGRVVEDVEKGLGVYGLSHVAVAGKERVDRARKRLVIESLVSADSADIVVKPATNRNLWEAERTRYTLRSVLESLDLPPGKDAVRRVLLEGGAPSLDATADDADEKLTAGFEAAVMAVFRDGSLNLAEKKAKIVDLLTAHDKLTATGDAAMPDKVESQQPDAAALKAELEELKAEKAKTEADKVLTAAVRTLCESEKFTPSDTQLTALKALPDDAARKTLIADLKPSTTPRSGYRQVSESTKPEGTPAPDAKTFASRIRA